MKSAGWSWDWGLLNTIIKIQKHIFLYISRLLWIQEKKNIDDQTLVNNLLQLRDNDPLWVTENTRISRLVAFSIVYGVVFKMNFYNSFYFMELSSNFNIKIVLLCKTWTKETKYVHTWSTYPNLLERKGNLRYRQISNGVIWESHWLLKWAPAVREIWGFLPINQEHQNQEHSQNVLQRDRAMCAEDLFSLAGWQYFQTNIQYNLLLVAPEWCYLQSNKKFISWKHSIFLLFPH